MHQDIDFSDLFFGSRLNGKNITLCVSGGIAAYKSIELLRSFQKSGAKVRVVMSKMATQFVGEETFSSLTGQKVLIDFEGMEHITLPHSSDLIVVAPATANVIAKFANGICDTMLTTILISSTCPIVFVPSMNWAMLHNPITQENIQKIKRLGHIVVQPDEGDLACGERGEGKFPSLDKILFHCEYALSQKRFSNKKVVITAGPTKEYIDDVRFISNPSSGFMGYVLSWESALEGAETYLVTGGNTFGAEKIINTKKVESTDDMLSEVRKLIPTDVFIGSAAVSDFKPSKKVKGKIKKEDTQKMTIELTRTPDILESAREHTKILVGFSLESDDIEKNTVYKMKRKRMDMIVGNTPESFSKSSGNYFIGYNTPEGIRIDKLGNIHKRKLAQKIIDKVIEIWNYL
ncbi:MAG: bifunctional phosphopantothenoylcysteine decarboxylase/phosphopantothenate--cysteine ligase CoaBC [Candidatus Calescibacterium sp.]|nr:bifunctional phosphopantothenoylcysteine decarboxylase/phosphopantothenate--cysteine ligase CoaBC [Candidatus Calescibacterium sp.]MDW8086959.1 bifunctional phosphopantothenoylcysteine decarboxylase/phosphopantothenate--cysteine ligase CoaBC [Candidatus Calescibacterium sp.]